MLFQSEKMKLETIRVVQHSKINDIYICRDVGTAAGSLYTLLVIRDHATTRTYLEMFEQAGAAAREAYVESFSSGGDFCMVFEYKQERQLDSFYMGEAYSLEECEEICRNLVITCMSSRLPYPLLYLALTQGQLHLAKDNTVYLGYQLDLGALQETRRQKDCVVQCALILCRLLQVKASPKAFTYRLLEKKTSRKSYESFGELYKDISLTSSSEKKSLLHRIRLWFLEKQDTLFRILLVICGFLAILMILSLATQMIYGDIPWLRLFFNSFKNIGTENLLQ